MFYWFGVKYEKEMLQSIYRHSWSVLEHLALCSLCYTLADI